MLTAYLSDNNLHGQIITADNQQLLNSAIWLDLFEPTQEEEDLLEKKLNIEIPTREEMSEIELSSRLYKEDDVLFMTVNMLADADSPLFKSDSVTLILAKNRLLTVRYIEPKTIKSFVSHIAKLPVERHNAIALFIELLEAVIDRLADILENISHGLDEYSHLIFPPKMHRNHVHKNYKLLLQEIGNSGNLNTKAEQSLASFNRLIFFLQKNIGAELDVNRQTQLGILTDDIKSLLEHVNFISNKVNFLFNATLGMVSIEQNDVIRIFTIAAVILLPPTLIATIYGMNFNVMPELEWPLGYPFSILLMLVSAYIPYKYFKKKKWL